MTEAVSWGAALQVPAAQGALFAASLLAVSALHKAVDRRRLREVAQRFTGAPGMPALALAGGAEIIAAAALAAPATRAVGALLAAGIWLVYFGFIARAVLQDRRELDCGCTFGSASAPLGAFHLGRNAFLAIIALLIAWDSMGDAPQIAASQLLAAAALLVLYAALDQVMVLQPLRRGETA